MRRLNPRRKRGQKGVALLLVLTTIAVLALVLVEFSSNAHTHLNTGVNIRDGVRATQLAETAFVMTRACLDETAWGLAVSARKNVDLSEICNIMVGMFVSGRVDLPVGGLSFELPKGFKGIGLERGEIEQLELVPEDAFIGLAGLRCFNSPLNCNTRRRVMSQLRQLLCDPAIAHIFEKEQEDGQRYTREEIVGNIIDWQDADNNRIYIDPLNWGALSAGAGEGEDAYLRDTGQRYASKDAPLESIEELRMIRGINDELYEFLKDKVSVFAKSARTNVNSASGDVVYAIIRSSVDQFVTNNYEGCGEPPGDNQNADLFEKALRGYSKLVTDARRARQQIPVKLPWRSKKEFSEDVKDPLRIVESMLNAPSANGFGEPMPRELILARYGFTQPGQYEAIQGSLKPKQIEKSITLRSNVYRLRIRAKVGNMTKQIMAVVRAEGKTVRTLYYREE